jgi:MscS family membrane protein
MTVENLTRSDKSLFRTKISLRYETSSAQLRSLLTETQNLLHNDSRVESQSVRVRFVGFGETGLDIELNCHILTTKFAEFLAIREELLLQIMDVVAGAGIRFAFPSRVLYAGREDVSATLQNLGADEMAGAARRKAG